MKRVLVVWAGWLVMMTASASPGSSQELGKYLASLGYKATVWVDFGNIAKHDYGTFNATVIGPSDFPSCYRRPIGPCIDAFNRRYGSSQGGGRLTAPWLRKGDLVGERFSQETLTSFFRKVGLQGTPTLLDREDAVLVAGVWDGLIAPSGAGVVSPPGSGGDPCAEWLAALGAWLASAPPPSSGGDCSELAQWLSAGPPPLPPSPTCLQAPI